MKPIRIAAVAAIVLVTVALAGVGRPEEARSDQGTPLRGITVNASGNVEATPDKAALELGVETQAPDAKTALAQNAERLNRVIAALRKAGVSKDDLQTSNVSLWPQREQRRQLDHRLLRAEHRLGRARRGEGRRRPRRRGRRGRQRRLGAVAVGRATGTSSTARR